MLEGMSNTAEVVRKVLKEQSEALLHLSKSFDEKQFEQAIALMLACSGHVVITGMGKSGLIGQKLSATLASTGTPSFYLHPSEAFHGDLGRITQGDVVVLISNSGETDELLQLIPSIRNFGNSIVAITNAPKSTMANNSDAVLSLNMMKETCPINLAPTTSTTLTTAVGDALAITLMWLKGFEPEDFARFHPGGSLGRQLLTRVKDVSVTKNLPLVYIFDSVHDVMLAMTASLASGVAVVVDLENRPVGVITDGDIRRALAEKRSLESSTAEDVMTRSPVVIQDNSMLAEATELMREKRVKSLIAVNETGAVTGILDVHAV